MSRPGVFRDLTQEPPFGRLTVLYRDTTRTDNVYWVCRCQCGDVKSIRSLSLCQGKTQSCGCLRRERLSEANRAHGEGGRSIRTTEYRVWSHIKGRCLNLNDKQYPDYGGRGIRVCAAWRDSYPQFLADVGRRPSKDLSLDREDNDGHYSCGKCDECVENGWPANCRWATREVQNTNRRGVIMVTLDGETRALSEWCRLKGIAYARVGDRLRAGWDITRALTTPVNTSSLETSPMKLRIAAWRTMIARCHNARNAKYPRYGGRGITVCARWRGSFDAYLEDTGPKPEGMSLDRKDNDKGYWCGKPECPECGPLNREPNCRWRDAERQANNRQRRVNYSPVLPRHLTA